MRNQYKNFKPFVIVCLFVIYTSCNAQDAANIKQSTSITIGQKVQKLGNKLWYVYQDKKNNYWFGSNGEGIYFYDGNTILNLNSRNGLCNDSIRQIQEDEFGNMYFSTMNGISKFDGHKFSTLNPIMSTEWKMEKHDLWFYMLGKKNEHGPYRYDGENLYHLDFPKHFLHDEISEKGINPFFSPYEVYCIYKDRKGTMWFGTSVFGACRFDGKSIKWMYEKDLTETPNGGGFGIRSIFEDQEGSFWFCNTWHRYIIDAELTESSKRLVYNKITGIGGPSNFDGDEYIYFSYIVEDLNKNIWLSTWDKGVYQYNGNTILHYPVKNGSSMVNLVSMFKDNYGNLWLGTAENGVFKFNGKAFENFKP